MLLHPYISWITNASKTGRLAALQLAGLRVNQTGQITDAQNEPFRAVRTTIKQREQFTDDDDQTLLEWVTRAELQGRNVSGFDIFEELQRFVSILDYKFVVDD